MVLINFQSWARNREIPFFILGGGLMFGEGIINASRLGHVVSELQNASARY